MKAKAKRPTREIARARALWRNYTKLEREYFALFDKQERLSDKKRVAAARYRAAKKAVDALMFARGLGSSKLPAARWWL